MQLDLAYLNGYFIKLSPRRKSQWNFEISMQVKAALYVYRMGWNFTIVIFVLILCLLQQQTTLFKRKMFAVILHLWQKSIYFTLKCCNLDTFFSPISWHGNAGFFRPEKAEGAFTLFRQTFYLFYTLSYLHICWHLFSKLSFNRDLFDK